MKTNPRVWAALLTLCASSTALAQSKTDLCKLVTPADIARITGFKTNQTGPSLAPGTATSCEYKSERNFGVPSIAVQVWVGSSADAAIASAQKMQQTKGPGVQVTEFQAVSGIGQKAYWYVMSGMGQLVVKVKPDRWFIVGVNTFEKTGNGKFRDSAVALGKWIIAQAKL